MMITNNIFNLYILKNLYIYSLIDTINIVAYKKIILIQLSDSMNHIQSKTFSNDAHMQHNQVYESSTQISLIV